MDDDKFSTNFSRKYFADHSENLNQVIDSLKRSRLSNAGHVTRLINKKMKKIFKKLKLFHF